METHSREGGEDQKILTRYDIPGSEDCKFHLIELSYTSVISKISLKLILIFLSPADKSHRDPPPSRTPSPPDGGPLAHARKGEE
jgi:hypothetical protein